MSEYQTNKKHNVVILQNSKEEADAIASGIAGEFNLLLATDNCASALETVTTSCVDFLIIGLILKNGDAVSIINKIKAGGYKTQCIVASMVAGGEMINDVIKAGARFYMIKPVDFQVLKEKMYEIMSADKQVSKNSESNDIENKNEKTNLKNIKQIEERISRIFIGMGIPPHIKGYGYLREGVKLTVGCPELINCVTKKLYPMIGEKFSTSASKVERAIRHAIEVAWNRGKVEVFNALFGVRAYNENERPTNSEFIALIADRLLLDEAGNL